MLGDAEGGYLMAMGAKVWVNCAAFFDIDADDSEQDQDPLDHTRIHPEDYELARKMATDALELDEEDVHDEHPSHVIELLLKDEDEDKKWKIDELNLDEFAVNMFETNQDIRRMTQTLIRAELLGLRGRSKPSSSTTIRFSTIGRFKRAIPYRL